MHEPLISPWRAWALADRGEVQLVDVRDTDERELPRVAGARLIPLDELRGELITLDRERPVVFLSGHGGRAAEAMGVLRAAGMTAHAVAGGVYAWVEAGLPLQPDQRPRPRSRAVVALGGNALLRRGEPLEAENQARAAAAAARLLAGVAADNQLVVTHGNGPQVGLLSLMSHAYRETAPYPLDVLGSETEGQIGYVLELELSNAIPHRETVAVLTRVVVDGADPAFSAPSKFIGPVYPEAEARSLAGQRGWTVKPDGHRWRRVVPSPEPRRIVQLHAIERLLDAGFLVVCTGGGGIPVVEDEHGHQRGVEAVIDKDLASALLASELGVDTLVLATDVDSVYEGYGTPDQRPIAHATPASLRSYEFAAGSMGPKVEAVCRFVERTGGRGVIGSLDRIDELFSGRSGTQVLPEASRAPEPISIDH